MARRMTIEEGLEFGRSLPVDLWLSWRTGKPLMSRSDWDQLSRWRRFSDWVRGRHPPKGFGERPARRDDDL